MKPFSYSTEGNIKNSSRGKGFPRHLWNQVTSLDEDTAVSYGYSGNRYIGNAAKMSMNKSYGNQARRYGHNGAYVKHSHATKWLRNHLGQNLDKVYSEFKAAWNSQPALKNSKFSPEEYFYGHVWKEGKQNLWKYGRCLKDSYRFIVDNQNRLQLNPDYKEGWRRKAVYDYMFVRDNRPILDELQSRFDAQWGGPLMLFHGGDAVGPIGVKKQLWILHPKTGMPVKASVALIRSAVFEEKKEKTSYWESSDTIGIRHKLSDNRVAYLREEYQPVSVIWDVFTDRCKLSVKGMRAYRMVPTDQMDWTFVVSKSQI